MFSGGPAGFTLWSGMLCTPSAPMGVWCLAWWSVLFSPVVVLFYRWEVVGRSGPPATSNKGSIVWSGVSGLCHRGGLWLVLSRAGGCLVSGGHVALGSSLVSCPPVDFPWMKAASSVCPCWLLLGFGMLGCISSLCSGSSLGAPVPWCNLPQNTEYGTGRQSHTQAQWSKIIIILSLLMVIFVVFPTVANVNVLFRMYFFFLLPFLRLTLV